MDDNITINSGGEPLEIVPKKMAENLRTQAIQSTNQLLDAENIAYIIYIDDKFDIDAQKEEFIGRMKKLKAESQYIKSEIFEGFNWEGPDELISKFWNNSENKLELLHRVCTQIKDEDIANVIPALEIKNCYGDRIRLMTPDEWVKDNYKLLKDLDEGKKALCLFDFEFQNGNKLVEGRTGVELAKIVIENQDVSDKIVCGIFSHKFTEEGEDEFRFKYSTEYNIDLKKFYTISKFRFAFDPQITGFAEGIKNLLLLPYVEDLKCQSVQAFKDSNKKATERFLKMSPKTFNQIVQKSSLKEGVWEVSTLFRLYGILSKEENLKCISMPNQRVLFNNSIKNIREIDRINTGYHSDTSNKQLIDLRESEVYLPAELMNPLYLPISNGDIFKIKDKEYMLLVQPCNLAVRATDGFCGKRAYNYNNGLLIPLKEGESEKLKSPAIEQLIKPGLIGSIKYADFSGYKNISLDLLDLVVFNDSGEAILDMKQASLDNDMIHFPWKKRYEYIYKEFMKHEKALVFFNNIRSKLPDKDVDIQGLKPFIYAPECLKELKISGNSIYDYANRTFNFKIKRITHYKSPYSIDLLQKFMSYLSRNAFVHDFTK